MTTFGQVVIGPPGSGKSTYCDAMCRFLRACGRDVCVVNLDPANESPPFEAAVSIGQLIRLEEVMATHKLGPNGALIFCMEFLDKNFRWLSSACLSQLQSGSKYFLFDLPGQVELYTHHDAVKNVVRRMEKELSIRLCAVHLVDSHYCNDPSKFISACLISMNTMLQVELPHINLLSKVDLVEKHGRLDFNFDFYTEVLDLNYLVDRLPDDPFTRKHKQLNMALIDLITNYSLVSFSPLSVQNPELLASVRNLVDKANGYCFASERERNLLMSGAVFTSSNFDYAKNIDVREKYMGQADDSDDS